MKEAKVLESLNVDVNEIQKIKKELWKPLHERTFVESFDFWPEEV